MKLRNKRILVTGGAGFIGSNLVVKLLEQGNKVIVLDNFSQGKRENLRNVLGNRNLKIIKGDILNDKANLLATKNIDIIFHMAVQCLRKSMRDPLYVHDVNATGTLKILLAAAKNRVKRFIYCSSSEVYGTASHVPMDESHPLLPTTVYGASKLAGEIYAKCFNDNFGIETIIVRPFNTYGYNSHTSGPYGEVIPRFVVRVKNGLPPIVFGNGMQTRDFTFVDDTVKGLIKAGTSDKMVGEVVNIARGVEVSIRDIANIIIKLIGKPVKIEYQKDRPHDVKRHFANVSKAKTLLGYKAKTEVKNGIKRYIEHLEKKNVDFKKLLNQMPERNW